jgi:hypothetical protein
VPPGQTVVKRAYRLKYSENTKLGEWVSNQRSKYGLQLEGKKSPVTVPRIQALESLGFEWKPSIGRDDKTPQKPSLDDNARCAHKKPANLRQGADSRLETAPFNAIFRATGYPIARRADPAVAGCSRGTMCLPTPSCS